MQKKYVFCLYLRVYNIYQTKITLFQYAKYNEIINVIPII